MNKLMDARKRGRPEASFNANGGHKRYKQEMGPLSTGVGSKSKPCTKFFSTAGCPFGESCHFLHYVPGGYNAVAQMMNSESAVTPLSRNISAPQTISSGSAPPAVRRILCNRYNTVEGCKFGDKCHFAHGEWEIGKSIAPSHDNLRAVRHIPSRMGGRLEPPPPGPASSFGASATAKISVDASLVGAIIGKGGVSSKQICRQTGAKLSIREHETGPSLRNIEFEGTFEQIKEASAMVTELIASISSTNTAAKPTGVHGGHTQRGSNYKKKLCDNFAKGCCSFGGRCHFAHGSAELRKPGVRMESRQFS